jgi:hypothetical protein
MQDERDVCVDQLASELRGAPIAVLDLIRRPPKITRNVSGIIVYAINRVSPTGSRPHGRLYVVNEGLSVAHPFRVHSDASPTVPKVQGAVSVEAPILDLLPRSKQRMLGHATALR